MSKLGHLYYHIFSTEEPFESPKLNTVDVFPDTINNAMLKNLYLPEGILFMNGRENLLYLFSDENSNKKNAWNWISKLSAKPEDYYYHGMFFKADNFGKWYYKGKNEEVSKAFETRKNSKKFGI